jgi:hypothetical protein
MRNRFFDWLASGLWFKYRSMQRVFLPVILALSFLMPVGAVAADTSNTFFVAQYAGQFEGVTRTVGNMTAAAQSSCAVNTAITCVIVFDPVLSQYPQGSMPLQCANCVWIDYRGITPFSTAGAMTNAAVALAVNSAVSATVPAAITAAGLSPVTFKNHLINTGGQGIDQRNAGAAQTITAGAALAYTIDHWWAASTGGNVTGQRIAGTGTGQYSYQFTGGAGVTGIKFGQRIEKADSINMGQYPVSLSVELYNSLLTSVTWTAYCANSDDTFGTLASPTKTQISTGTFTGTIAGIYRVFPLPDPGMVNCNHGIEVVFSVGAQTSGTWAIGNVQLEQGSVATPFEVRDYRSELARAQRYYWKTFPQGTAPATGASIVGALSYAVQVAGTAAGGGVPVIFPVTMRGTPTVTTYNYTSANAKWRQGSGDSGTPTIYGLSAGGMMVFNPQVAGDGAGVIESIHATAEAEIP